MMENNPSDIVNYWLAGCKAEKVEGGRPVTVYGKNTWPADDEWCLGQEQMVSGELGWARCLIAMEMGTWLQWITRQNRVGNWT